MPPAIRRFLESRSLVEIAAIGVVLLAAVGAVDYAFGYQLSFSIFYLVPIVVVSWHGSRPLGFVFCVLATLVGLSIDHAALHYAPNPLYPIWNAGVRLGFFLLTAYLLGEVKGRFDREKALASTDGLTGVLNAGAFKEVSRTLLELAARHDHPTALGYVDLDNFKAVNDALGHSEGDLVLKSVGDTLLRSVRAADLVGRLGGDEFGVLLPETGRAGACMVFGRLRQELARTVAQGGWPIGFSIGVALFPTAPAGIDEALGAADELMYRVKKAGKNHLIYEDCSAPSTAPPRSADRRR